MYASGMSESTAYLDVNVKNADLPGVDNVLETVGRNELKDTNMSK